MQLNNSIADEFTAKTTSFARFNWCVPDSVSSFSIEEICIGQNYEYGPIRGMLNDPERVSAEI